MARYINGESILDGNCNCDSFGDCHLGLHKAPACDKLWAYYDIHDLFPDVQDWIIDLYDESNNLHRT